MDQGNILSHIFDPDAGTAARHPRQGGRQWSTGKIGAVELPQVTGASVIALQAPTLALIVNLLQPEPHFASGPLLHPPTAWRTQIASGQVIEETGLVCVNFAAPIAT